MKRAIRNDDLVSVKLLLGHGADIEASPARDRLFPDGGDHEE